MRRIIRRDNKKDKNNEDAGSGREQTGESERFEAGEGREAEDGGGGGEERKEGGEYFEWVCDERLWKEG